MATERQPHQMVVGDRAHRIIAATLVEGIQPERRARTLQVIRHGRTIFQEHPIDYRPREALVDAVTAAGVYLSRFLPRPPWKLAGVEVCSGRSRLDIVHRRGRAGYLIDEVKLGVGRYGESAVQKQIDRYLEVGQGRWGAEFLGVRLCTVHEPFQSRLHSPDGTNLLLAESDLSEELWVR